MNLKLRFFVAAVIIVLSYIYFRFFPMFSYSLAHAVYFVLVITSVAVAFLTSRRDVTYGILYGLTIVFLVLMIVFLFFSKSL